MIIKKRENFTVIVTPKRLGDYGGFRTSDTAFRTPEQVEKDYIERCKEIEEDIKRHVDNVSYVEIQWDNVYSCSHCGWGLSEEEIKNPDCCQAAIDEVQQLKFQEIK